MAEKGLDFSNVENKTSQTDYLFTDIKAQMKMAKMQSYNPRGQLGLVNDFAKEEMNKEMMKERQTIKGAEDYFDDNIVDDRKNQFNPYELQLIRDIEKAYAEHNQQVVNNDNNNTENN